MKQFREGRLTMNVNQVESGASPIGPHQHTGKDKNNLRESEREWQLARKRAEFSQRQADRLMKLAEQTRDPQLRAQLVVMSNGWIDRSARTRLRFKLVDAWRRYSSRTVPG